MCKHILRSPSTIMVGPEQRKGLEVWESVASCESQQSKPQAVLLLKTLLRELPSVWKIRRFTYLYICNSEFPELQVLRKPAATDEDSRESLFWLDFSLMAHYLIKKDPLEWNSK